MKIAFFIVFLASFFACNELAKVLDFNTFLRGFAESTRKNFKCGFPGTNIPVLDPLHVAHYSVAFDEIGDLEDFHSDLSYVTVNDLSKFTITDFKANLLGLTLTFGLTFPTLSIYGIHDSSVRRNKNKFDDGHGFFSITVEDAHVEVAISFGLFPFTIKSNAITDASIGHIDSNFYGFKNKAKNRKVGEGINEGASEWLTHNLNQINSDITNAITGFTNDRLESLLSIDNVLDAIKNYNPANCV
ncbi:CLUMA_CG004611, isoform A [Clunio marinus]|uniref:CLUMA_CG004611, isoform A n=1 Tax=Clunio marinus TaxID=568069 RepID=A0A1J1HTN7_9DIPT|nr:CLUMA_CG004611, isoform A [Clunio marinus]